MIWLLTFTIGVVAGLRTMMAPAAVSWAATQGRLDVSQTWLAFLAYRYAFPIFGVCALGELITDQLPSTPSRKVPVQFTARIGSGFLSGAAIGAPSGAWVLGGLAGVVGAVAGTLGGSAARGAMASAFGNDRPAAVIEDMVAFALAAAVVLSA